MLNSANAGARLWSNIRATALMLNVTGDHFARHNVPGRPEVFLPVGILFLLGLGLGLQRIAQRSPKAWPFVLTMVWLAFAAVPAVLSNENMPHALRSILMIPPCFILAALGAEQLRLWIEPRVSRQTLMIGASALGLLLTPEAYWTYFHISSPILARVLLLKGICRTSGVRSPRRRPPQPNTLSLSTPNWTKEGIRTISIPCCCCRAGSTRASGRLGTLAPCSLKKRPSGWRACPEHTSGYSDTSATQSRKKVVSASPRVTNVEAIDRTSVRAVRELVAAREHTSSPRRGPPHGPTPDSPTGSGVSRNTVVQQKPMIGPNPIPGAGCSAQTTRAKDAQAEGERESHVGGRQRRVREDGRQQRE